MSIEDTQRAMDAYIEDLLGGGPYGRHFSDDVVVSIVGTGQGAEGADGVEAWIGYLHRVAFEARPELENTIVGDGQAVGEFDFVGKHIGECGGIAATGREVSVPYCMVYELGGEKIRVLRGYMPMDIMMQQPGGGVFPEEQIVEPSH